MIGVEFASASRFFASAPPSARAETQVAAELREDLIHARHVRAVILFDQLIDLVSRRDDDLNFASEREAQILRRLRIQRIAERDLNRVPIEPERDRMMQHRQPRLHQPQHFLRRFEAAEIHIIRPDRGRECLVKFLLRDDPIVPHRIDQTLARLQNLGL